MKDTAPKGLGIIAIAGVFGIIATGVAYVMWEMGLIGSVFIGVVVAALVCLLLLWGWREPAKRDTSMPSPTQGSAAKAAAPAAAAAPTAAAAAPAASAPAAAATAAPTATTAEPAAKPAAKAKAKPAAKAKPKAATKPKAAAKPAAAKKAASDKATAKAEPKAKARPVAADGKPELLKAARAGGPDDLKQIKGVGPKMEKMLHDMGIFHFDQVAGWRKKEVEWVDANLEGFNGRVSRDEWVKQAKVLARGGTTEFSSKVKKGGIY